ncbi:MAG: hypothetical protein UT08_C0021G0008 [Candidatus Woesebacteria bacterium GW2011_GWB1_38_8]|uniref:Uncharacterized protein n=1 Tax=Candidatus Woesebacteria bacterium GW2011_GWB1_38_8 TaxID=1618570 RepID=A0A0G0P4J7_9BACT|nr:MAG: hypothetical protein UT08_C0021G0008 [Candidatus Woesebacteria bacterium GW2011_GWB1_38_8]
MLGKQNFVKDAPCIRKERPLLTYCVQAYILHLIAYI